MPLVASRDLCVDGIAVPVVSSTMDVVDPFGLHEGKDDALDVSLVEFSASGCMHWLQKVLKVGPKWFKENANRIPLLKEILEIIRKQKNKEFGRGASVKTARLPRCRDCLIAIKVRGQVLLVKNDSRYVSIADLKGPGSLTKFNWFLGQLESDVGDLEEMDSDERAERARAKEPREEPAEIQTVVEEALQSLRAHENCKSAAYFKSRNSFQVKRGGDKDAALFRVQSLAKKRKVLQESAGELMVVRTQFDLAVARATSFLENECPVPLEESQGSGASAESQDTGTDDMDPDDTDTDGLAVPKNFAEPEAEPAGPAGPAASSSSRREPAERSPSC